MPWCTNAIYAHLPKKYTNSIRTNQKLILILCALIQQFTIQRQKTDWGGNFSFTLGGAWAINDRAATDLLAAVEAAIPVSIQ